MSKNPLTLLSVLFTTTFIGSLATPAEAVTLSDAQKAYVAGNWKEAAAAYEEACPSEAADKQTECYLWNVLALSQTGAAKDFSKAGKRLDSLITATNPQNKIYADLMMTKAQFLIYLGKYEKSADALIHAIETSQPHQVTVLQKVCVAVQAKTKNERLDEACKSLSEPRATLEPVAAAPAPEVQPSEQPSTAPSTVATDTNAVSEAKPAMDVPAPAAAEQPKAAEATPPTAPVAAAPAAAVPAKTEAKPQPATAPAAAPAPKEYWTLQLGAFGVKSNADILVSNLKKRGITAKIEERPGETKTLYIVQSGEFATKDAAIDFGAQKLAPINLEFRAILRK